MPFHVCVPKLFVCLLFRMIHHITFSTLYVISLISRPDTVTILSFTGPAPESLLLSTLHPNCSQNATTNQGTPVSVFYMKSLTWKEI